MEKKVPTSDQCLTNIIFKPTLLGSEVSEAGFFDILKESNKNQRSGRFVLVVRAHD